MRCLEPSDLDLSRTPANVIIYNVPLEWRVLSSNCVDLVWGYVCSKFAADACAVDDEECLLEAVDDFASPMASRRPPFRRLRAAARLLRRRAADRSDDSSTADDGPG